MNNLITVRAGHTQVETNSPTLARQVLEFVTGLDVATGRTINAELVNAPSIGVFWGEQGGIYAGVMRGENGEPDYHLIVSEKGWGQAEDIQWGGAGNEVGGANHERDGQANTKAILSSKGTHPAAEFVTGLNQNSHADWYLPSRRELALCYASVPEQFDKKWYWSSTQHSPVDAWDQLFDVGNQSYGHKGGALRARAVRRFIIDSTI